MPAQGAQLALRHVSVRYGQRIALDAVSLDIEPGESLALVGPSGAGKTTLLKLFNGGVRPDAGTVRVDGQALGGLSPGELKAVRAATGFVAQGLCLVPNLRVLQNVVSGRLGRRSLAGAMRDLLFPSRVITEAAHRTLAQVGIAERIYERTDRLSGGQQQRVAIARALFQQPRVLLCDEPVASVDPERARAVLELLQDLSRDHGLTLCVSLHHLDLAREYFPRLIALREGRVLFDKPTASLGAADFGQVYRLTDGDASPRRAHDLPAAGEPHFSLLGA